MKKVGILTFHYAENKNFGAILQSYAMVTLLKKLNCSAKLIDYKFRDYSFLTKLKSNITGSKFYQFKNTFLDCTEPISEDKLKELNAKFDAFVVGSDQVWRMKWLKNKVKHYFFDFVDTNKLKISYAASFGVDFWEGKEPLTSEVKELIKKFDSISVREESGIDICRETFDVGGVVNVLDPTLMLNREDYETIINKTKNLKYEVKEKYIASMILDESDYITKTIDSIGKNLNLRVEKIKGKTINILGKKITFYNKVGEWLNYLKNAELVVTDSFHCAVFSIIFNKKFIVIANPERGVARLENLLTKVGLKNRFFTDLEILKNSKILREEIDYFLVENKLEKDRKKSMDFLKKALSNEKGKYE